MNVLPAIVPRARRRAGGEGIAETRRDEDVDDGRCAGAALDASGGGRVAGGRGGAAGRGAGGKGDDGLALVGGVAAADEVDEALEVAVGGRGFGVDRVA